MAALREGTVMGEWTHPLIALAGKAYDYARRGFRRPAPSGATRAGEGPM